MGIVSWVVLGLIAGLLAKWLMPGKDPGGLLVTIGLGILGAFVGGLVASQIGMGRVDGIDLESILIAMLGSIGCLALYRMVKK